MELIDVLTSAGEPTGTTKLKPLVHRDGDWHRAVHVWIVQRDGRVLVQRRARMKENNPDLWDVSAAGHVSAGEPLIDACVRETAEELGIDVEPRELVHVESIRAQSILNGGAYIDNEVHEIFIVRRDVELAALSLQKEEVDDAQIVTWAEFARMRRVPHGAEYALIERASRWTLLLQTPRLALVSPSPETIRALMARDTARASALLGATVPAGWPVDEDAREGLDWHLAELGHDPDEREWRIRLVIERASNSVIGSVNLKGAPVDGDAELGWGIVEQMRDRGYATEAARAVIDWALATGRVQRVSATIDDSNARSIRVASRLGMTKAGEMRRGLPLWATI